MLRTVLLLVLTAMACAAVEPDSGLDGLWTGEYYYRADRDPVPFSMVIGSIDEHFTGRLMEPNTFGDPSFILLQAEIHGTCQGRVISFTKSYDGAGGAAHGVEYSGVFTSAERMEAIGTWAIGAQNGLFRIKRPVAQAAPMVWKAPEPAPALPQAPAQGGNPAKPNNNF
jgi:hypothetical protein